MWMTRKQAAEYMQVSVKTIDRWVREGVLIAFKTVQSGKKIVRFRRQDLDGIFTATGQR